MRREDDKVTKWIKHNWRDPYDGHPNMVLAMVVARTVNWPDTLAEIGFPLSNSDGIGWWMDRARAKMKARRANGDKVWTGAYLVSTNGNAMDKIDYIIDRVWKPLSRGFSTEALKRLEENYCLETVHRELMAFDGLGSFMAAQVVCDLKYTTYICGAGDWDTWSAIGPGSKRGMNRYYGVENIEKPISSVVYNKQIAAIQVAVHNNCGLALHAQDIQNCLCEYDKYCRVRLGEGKPRSGYNGRK